MMSCMSNPFSHLTSEYISAQNKLALEKLRERVDIAESGLRNARDMYEAEITRQGLPTRCIFSHTFFICRTSAESWLAEAQNKFEAQAAREARELKAALKKLAAKKADDDEQDPVNDEPREGDDVPNRPRDKGRKKPIVTDEEVDEAEREHARIHAAAAAIIAAGARRRNDTPALPTARQSHLQVVPNASLPPKGTIARRIIDAGIIRRGGIPDRE